MGCACWGRAGGLCVAGSGGGWPYGPGWRGGSGRAFPLAGVGVGVGLEDQTHCRTLALVGSGGAVWAAGVVVVGWAVLPPGLCNRVILSIQAQETVYTESAASRVVMFIHHD